MGLKPYDRKISQIFNNIEYDVTFINVNINGRMKEQRLQASFRIT